MNDPFNPQKWKSHNIAKLEEAIEALYDTVISEDGNAELRGIAITAIDRIIINIHGESAVDKIELVPYSARLRESKDITLRKLSNDIGNHFSDDRPE